MPQHRWAPILVLVAPLLMAADTGARPTYYHHDRCGRVVPELAPPTTHVRGDVDGDGVDERFVAHGGVLERHRLVEAGRPPSTERVGDPLYEGKATSPYACADILLQDLDGDGDLDVVYATPRELVVLDTYKSGFRPIYIRRHERLTLRADVRIEAKDLDGTAPLDIVLRARNEDGAVQFVRP